ncbi:MAG: type II toxin-antitoxin system RelE/ParE family toxin [Thermaceae bacterium]|nr:type II toxin-antitoxin system RelE/ParE family toxin [Thermaceae bacterium]
MSPKLIYRPEAEADLKEAYGWYSAQNTGADFLSKIGQITERIEENPEQFPKVFGYVRRALLKGFPYAVFFTGDELGVVVIAVFRQRRDPRRWQERLG